MTTTQKQEQRDADRTASTAKTLGKDQNDQSSAGQTSDDASWIDPVCGMNVKRLSAFFTAEHGGTTSRFCSEACRTDFEKDPERFTKASWARAAD